MPIFEYVCKNCGSKFEKLVLAGRRGQQVRCPECSSNSVEKALSLFGCSGDPRESSGSNCAPSG